MTAAEAAHQLVTVVANRRASGNTDLGHPCSFSLLSLNSFLLVFSIHWQVAT